MTNTHDWADEKAMELVHRWLEAFHIAPRHEPPRVNLYDEVAAAIRIPADCVRRGSDGKLLRITHAIIDDAEGEPLAFGYQCVPAEAAEAARGEESK